MVRPHSEPRRKGKADPGCPYCSGRKVLAGFNDLATTHPDIAAMWHPRMNKRLKPAGVQAVSRKLAWRRGECGHVYQMAVSDRVRAKPGCCPYCSGRKRPERPIRLD
ncbi:MAG: zinc-ribbon domain-containing protein [Adlercreutzia sp.]|nr:zinc-ribbon domain-containing protein [Adlercreutzia sp.]